MANVFDDIPEQYPVDEIIDCFEFEKVEAYMRRVNWEILTSTGFRVPDVATLKDTARRLLTDLRDEEEEYMYYSTAGFFALKFAGRLSLHFHIASYEEDNAFTEYLERKYENLDNNTNLE